MGQFQTFVTLPQYHCMGDWVGHRGGLDVMAKREKESCTLSGIEPQSSTFLTDLAFCLFRLGTSSNTVYCFHLIVIVFFFFWCLNN
jgi:hypothetical protein